MKVRIEAGAVVMAPETEEDHAAMHQMKCCGIKSMHMLNSAVDVHGPGLRGPLVVETYPEKHGIPGSLNQSSANT